MATEESEITNACCLLPHNSDQSLEDAIRQRAYAIYELRGASDGNPVDDWLRAEAEILAQLVGSVPESAG